MLSYEKNAIVASSGSEEVAAKWMIGLGGLLNGVRVVRGLAGRCDVAGCRVACWVYSYVLLW